MNLLGIDIGGTKTSVCVGTRDGDILASQRMPTHTSEGPEATVRRTLELANDVLAEAGVALSDIPSVGLSSPGPVSVADGLMVAPPNMKGWENVPIVRMFADALGKPVHMNNDANACVLAEHLFGEFRSVADLVYLTMSTGLGAGFISGGQLVQGITDTGGEIGHHVLDINGPPCPCGQRGCLELYCGGMNVANRLRERIRTENIRTAILDEAGGDLKQIDFRAFVAAVRGQDAFALEAWDEYLERLAQGIGTVIMFMNPQAIVLGTIGIHAGDLIIPRLHERLQRYAWPQAVAACTIAPSRLGTRIGDLSALALAIQGTAHTGC